MPRDNNQNQKAFVPNCAKADTTKNLANTLPSDISLDLQEAFNFYYKEQSGYISIAHFRNILHNFGYHKLSITNINQDLVKCDSEFMKRNCVDMAFVKYAVAYRWTSKGGREAEAQECFKVIDRKDRGVVTKEEIETVL